MSDLTAEEKEEKRLQATMAKRASGAAGHPSSGPKWSERHAKDTAAKPAAGAAVEKVAPLPKQQKTAVPKTTNSRMSSDYSDPSLMHPASKQDRDREQTIIAAAKGDITPNKEAVKEAVAAEKERLGDIFKCQHTGFKQKWAIPANEKQRQENLEQQLAAEREEKRLQEEEEARKEERALLIEARRLHAQEDADAAKAHYAPGDSVDEPYLNDLELDVSEALVRLRKDPHSFLPVLRERKSQFEGLIWHFEAPDGVKQDLRTAEGAGALQEAMTFIETDTEAGMPSLKPSKGLTKAMYHAVQKAPSKPAAMKLLQKYGKVSGSARQFSYVGPVGTADDMIASILADDGNSTRTRRKGLLDPKFRKFGVCGGTSLDGKTNFMFIVVASNFKDAGEEE